MYFKVLRLLLLLAFYPALTLSAATLEDGYTAFERGDVAQAEAIWRELAEQGNATAQLNLGQLYRQGKGVPLDDTEAVKWYTMAAQNHSDIARYTLALMHRDGRASDEDLAEAGLALSPGQETQVQPENAASTPPAEDWVSGLPPDAYLIQIIASSNRTALDVYAEDKLPGVIPPPRVIRSSHNGMDWYQLVIGPFASPQTAQTAVARLPDEVKKNKPWVRSVGSL